MKRLYVTKISFKNQFICEFEGLEKHAHSLSIKMPEQIWHNEVGAPDIRIIEPFESYVLTPHDFSISSLVLGSMLNRSGIYSLSANTTENNNLKYKYFFAEFDLKRIENFLQNDCIREFEVSKGQAVLPKNTS